MYGGPESASGMVLMCGAVILCEELGGAFEPYLVLASRIARNATLDVPRESSTQSVELCYESLSPSLIVSYEALSRHTKRFLELLEGQLSAGTNVLSQE